MKRDREEPLLAPGADAVAEVEERPRTQPSPCADANLARPLDDVEVVRLAARRRRVDRLLDLGNADQPQRRAFGFPMRGQRDTGRERGKSDEGEEESAHGSLLL